MATFTTTYVGKDATGLLGKAIANTYSLSQDGFTIKENQKGYSNIRIVDGSVNLWADDDGTFASAGDLAFVTKKVTLAFKKLNHILLKKDLAVDWASVDLAGGAAGTLGGQTSQAIQEECLRVVAQATDAAIWSGLVTEANADGTVVDQAVSTFTAANVVAELGKITAKYATMTNNLGQTANIYLHPTILAMYNTALSAQGNNDSRGFKATDFEGYKFVSSINIPVTKVFMTPKENMFFCVDQSSDLNNFSVLDQSSVTGANALHLVVNASYVASYARGSELVLGTAS